MNGSAQVDHRRGEDLVREATWLPMNSGWGSHRASFPPIRTDDLVARLMWMPPGQRSPWHGSGGWPELGQPFPPLSDGAIFVNVEGQVAFEAGGATFDLEPNDVLVVNAVVYSYYNASLCDSLFWTIQPRRDRPHPANAATPGGEPVWQGDAHASAMSGSHPYYDSEPPPASDALERMRALHWADYRRQAIDWHGDWGAHWGAYPLVEAGVRGRMLRVPAGQHTDSISAELDTLLLGIGADAVDVVVGDRHCGLASRDALLVPAGIPFSILNPGLCDALCFEMQPARPADTGGQGAVG